MLYKVEIYGKSMSIVKDFAEKDKKMVGFLKIDREWAENVLFRYKRAKHHLMEQQESDDEKPTLKTDEFKKKRIEIEIVNRPGNKKDAEKDLAAVTDTLTEAVSNGDKVQLVGFGSFEVKQREARVGRNPKTKEAIEIPATRVPVFKAGRALTDSVAK